MPRRKEPRIPDAVLDQLLAGADPKAAFDPGGLLDGLRGRLRSQGAGNRFRFGWARRWSMSRIMASLTMVSETSGSSSYALARRRQRPSQASVLSATQRRGRRTEPVVPASRRTTISVRP